MVIIVTVKGEKYKMMENNQNEEKIGAQSAEVQNGKEKSSTVEDRIVEVLRTVYDPEIPVNIYDLGLIYKIDYNAEKKLLDLDMTLTAPGCPMADYIMEDVRQKLMSVEGVQEVNVNIVFEPEWNESMMDEQAKADLGLL